MRRDEINTQGVPVVCRGWVRLVECEKIELKTFPHLLMMGSSVLWGAASSSVWDSVAD